MVHFLPRWGTCLHSPTSGNFLSGSIPPSLGNLSSLQSLYLADNMLSGQIPKELGNLSNLLEMTLHLNELTGQLPPELERLRSLIALVLSSNKLTGQLPRNYANFTKLWIFSVAGNRLTGQIPRFIANWTQLSDLYLSGNDFEGQLPQELFNLSKLEYLVVSDVRSSGFSFPERANMTKITYLDLSFNNLTGGIPDSMKKLNFNDSLYINCGGIQNVFEEKLFDGDSATSNFYTAPKKNWAYACSGDFDSETDDSSDYIKNVECAVCDTAETFLYNSTRFCPLSLTYYGFCLFKGHYTVRLYFAENVYQNDEGHASLGRRVFDVYMQGKRILKDFNIKERARGADKPWTQNFTAFVGDDNLLEIHFFWAGKGSFLEPSFRYKSSPLSLTGPLVSGISVTANFEVRKKLSPSKIAGITVGSVFALLLLLAFMWKMGWLRKSELDEIIIEVQGRSFTLKKIIDATRNFSPKKEIGKGRFGIVYKAELSNQIKLAVKKISPQTKQQGKDELQREIYNLKSLRHENLVQLLDGYSKKGLNLLVYEYMEKGSLHHTLFEPNSTTKLDWEARYDICLGIAKGLKYLHEEKRFKIVHGNIKASNIMLDKNLTAKLSDFGLATLYDEEDPFMTIKAKGLRGKTGAEYKPNQEADFLLDTAGVLYEQGRILDLVDKKLSCSYDRKQALILLHLAIKCVNLSPTLRPKMSEVISVLTGEKNIQQISQGDTPLENIGGSCDTSSRVPEINPTP
ncbi:unnamed protein product [Dovyalis caffra]|uniref:non-specific serine/threonine protein kinase n=1 Tax=Dovyalis caffra TaxID=77055 RepID=A0AAV1S2N4_9ROSI|nr:unnamed protein product [Dovyalis caffra]